MKSVSFRTVIVIAVLFELAPAARSAPLQVDWITQYCNESIQSVDLAQDSRMIRNISNSYMTQAPSFLDGATYLQRRSDTNLCPDLAGIAELSMEWLRPDRVSLSAPAVVVVAVNELSYPNAGALLKDVHWSALDSQIHIEYNEAPRDLKLYAGLVPAGSVDITGSFFNEIVPLEGVGARSSFYFFFQPTTAFSPETLAELQTVAVPEPTALALIGIGAFALITFAARHRFAR